MPSYHASQERAIRVASKRKIDQENARMPILLVVMSKKLS